MSNLYNWGGNLNYSLEEQIVGTWINGKPIYQKTYVWSGTLPTNGTTKIPAGIDADTIVNIGGIIYRSGFFTKVVEPQSTGQLVNTYYFNGDGNIYIHSILQYQNATAWITLQYTKTTD